ncbi:hypothetical protein LBMAG49_02010 [Planctomycetota bacterium]|nr:hypothetical protein LBMAG49_02010 [Planctomycetota bacterium]
MVTSIEAPYYQKKQGNATRLTGKQPNFICAANNANRSMTPLRKSRVLKKSKQPHQVRRTKMHLLPWDNIKIDAHKDRLFDSRDKVSLKYFLDPQKTREEKKSRTMKATSKLDTIHIILRQNGRIDCIESDIAFQIEDKNICNKLHARR